MGLICIFCKKCCAGPNFTDFLHGPGRVNDFHTGSVGAGPKIFGPCKPPGKIKSRPGLALKKEVCPAGSGFAEKRKAQVS